MRYVFIVNPAAARFSPALADRIRRGFPGATLWKTGGPGDARRLARRARDELSGEPGTVVACGGDGTFREVASGVGPSVRVGFVPLGTVNLVARELAIPLAFDGALGVLRSGEPRPLFGGRCFADGAEEGQLFLIGLSAGPDADAVHAVRPLEKRLCGRYSYAVRFAVRMARPVRPVIRYRSPRCCGACGELLLLRTPHYGGCYRISESLEPGLPGLELVAVAGRLPLAALFWSAFRSRVRPLPGVTRALVEEVEVDLPGEGRFQMDGDAFRAVRLRVTADPNPVLVLAPPA